VADCPALTVEEPGVAESEKSGAGEGGGVTPDPQLAFGGAMPSPPLNS